MNVNNYVIPASSGQDLLENIRLALDQKPTFTVYLKRWYNNQHIKDSLRNECGNENGIKTIMKIPLERMKGRNEIYSYFIEIENENFNLIQALITITPNRNLSPIRIKVNISL